MSNVLAIVPARGGSKGIVDKNIADLGGRPLIAWTLAAAAASTQITRTIVSTDSPAIADAAGAHGADVPFMRPEALAADDTPMIPVLIHALNWLAEHEAYEPDVLVLLQPTSPLRTAEDIDGAMELMRSRDADAVVGVCPARTHPALTRKLDAAGRLSPFVEGLVLPDCRQGAQEAYEINGAIYAIKPHVLRERNTWYSDCTLGYVMPLERSGDVDEPVDLEMVRTLLGAHAAEADHD